jgi:hydrogenase small subunit
MITGGLVRILRGWTERTVDREPKWRTKDDQLHTGYDPPWDRR